MDLLALSARAGHAGERLSVVAPSKQKWICLALSALLSMWRETSYVFLKIFMKWNHTANAFVVMTTGVVM